MPMMELNRLGLTPIVVFNLIIWLFFTLALLLIRSATSGTVMANSQFSSSLRWVSRGCITRALVLAGHISTQLPQPVQSRGLTCMRYSMPANSLPVAFLVT